MNSKTLYAKDLLVLFDSLGELRGMAIAIETLLSTENGKRLSAQLNIIHDRLREMIEGADGR